MGILLVGTAVYVPFELVHQHPVFLAGISPGLIGAAAFGVSLILRAIRPRQENPAASPGGDEQDHPGS